MGDFWLNIKTFGQNNVFFDFSNKNYAESSRNFVKNQVLNLKHAKFDQKSEIGHVRTCQGAHKAPYGPQPGPGPNPGPDHRENHMGTIGKTTGQPWGKKKNDKIK